MPAGKPYFPQEPALHFSVSHSGDCWLCAFWKAPIGLDVQKKKTRADWRRLAARFFHPEEADWLKARDIDAFFSLWTGKEAYCKFTGEGLASFRQFSLVRDGALLIPPAQQPFFHPDYALCFWTAGPPPRSEFRRLP